MECKSCHKQFNILNQISGNFAHYKSNQQHWTYSVKGSYCDGCYERIMSLWDTFFNATEFSLDNLLDRVSLEVSQNNIIEDKSNLVQEKPKVGRKKKEIQ